MLPSQSSAADELPPSRESSSGLFAHEPSRIQPSRKQLGAWATPSELVDLVVEHTVTAEWVRARSEPITVLDPACGDGRFLRAVARRVRALGGTCRLTGVDVDQHALGALTAAASDADATADLADAETRCADALRLEWGSRSFDLVVGNPPFLSQLATATTRGGASRHGGGPYADAAAEFLALAVRLAAPGGRVGMVLPQSILASRDAADVRAAVGRQATMTWSWWSPRRHFTADVLVCALAFERHGPAADDRGGGRAGDQGTAWNRVVLGHLGVPDLPELTTQGCVGDRTHLNANFRDEYYGLVGAVTDTGSGPPLVTSGLIDPGRCLWGHRPVRFAKQRFTAPRVDRDRLDPRMQRWAVRKLVPKVLVASQTAVVEAVVDPGGAWLPGVPVTTAEPAPGVDPWAVGAVLTSPVAAAAAWHRAAGTGLSARSIRIGPATVAALPWPAGRLDDAVAALRAGDVIACGRAVLGAFGLDLADPLGTGPLEAWWSAGVARLPPA